MIWGSLFLFCIPSPGIIMAQSRCFQQQDHDSTCAEYMAKGAVHPKIPPKTKHFCFVEFNAMFPNPHGDMKGGGGGGAVGLITSFNVASNSFR